jgi:Mrp family chromosome partitioning ATPase
MSMVQSSSRTKENTVDWDRQLPFRQIDMVSLYHTIKAKRENSGCFVLQIIATTAGEGVTSLARGLAKAASSMANDRVLLCDATGTGDIFQLANVRQPVSLIAVAEGRSDIGAALSPTANDRLTLAALTDKDVHDQAVVRVEAVAALLERLRSHFDLMIIDAPAGNDSMLGVALSRYVDGVVVVIEAEKTRGPALAAMLKNIDINGGNLIGTVMNKRRFHIPRSIYRWL